ncbi:MAG: hypothetical protein IPK00_16115 [Deltaproteobacteria bacterium]|nr:hypothetical protein [Deltaproteobacteria bacterium]
MEPLRNAGRALFRGHPARLCPARERPDPGFPGLSRRVLELYVGDAFPADYPDVDVLLIAHRHGLRIGERPVHMTASPRASLLHSGLAPSTTSTRCCCPSGGLGPAADRRSVR